MEVGGFLVDVEGIRNLLGSLLGEVGGFLVEVGAFSWR